MDFLKEFDRMMDEAVNIALATSVEDMPNVRIVNFCYDPKNKGIIYFSSFRGLPKTVEFSQNNNVAFTTVPTAPTENSEHVRVTNASVKKSDFTIYDLKDAFLKKLPSYEMLIVQAGDMFDVYEIHFKEANVIVDVRQSGNVTL